MFIPSSGNLRSFLNRKVLEHLQVVLRLCSIESSKSHLNLGEHRSFIYAQTLRELGKINRSIGPPIHPVWRCRSSLIYRRVNHARRFLPAGRLNAPINLVIFPSSLNMWGAVARRFRRRSSIKHRLPKRNSCAYSIKLGSNEAARTV